MAKGHKKGMSIKGVSEHKGKHKGRKGRRKSHKGKK